MPPPRRPSQPEESSPDPNVGALASIEALHEADPAALNPEVRRLQRFAALRKRLYYSVLWPWGALSRFVPGWFVPLSAAVAAAGFFVVVFNPDVPVVVALLLGLWAAGAGAYFAVSVTLAGRLEGAARSVGLDPRDVMRRWASQARGEADH